MAAVDGPVRGRSTSGRGCANSAALGQKSAGAGQLESKVKFGVLTAMILQRAWLVAILCIAGPALADQYRPPDGVEVVDYQFLIELTPASDRIQVTETLEALFSKAGVANLDLDLCSVREVERQDPAGPCQAPKTPAGQPPLTTIGKGMAVASVSVNGLPALYDHLDDRLTLTLPRPSKAGERLTIELRYGGVPAAGLVASRNKDGERVFFSDNWPNKGRNWLATVDHISSKATATISVVAPSDYQVVSNGRLTEEVDLPGRTRRTTWREAVRIPVWQFALGVAPMRVEHFGSAGGVEFSAWLSPENTGPDLDQIRDTTRSVLAFYSELLGPYPFEKLAHVEAMGGPGAMENASSIFYRSGFAPLPHEVAHQWFGNSVSESSWDEVWLSEGFATYLDLLYIERSRGREAFLAGLRHAQEIAVDYSTKNPTRTIVHPKGSNENNLLQNAPQIYLGGALVLHTLRGVLGDARFFSALKLFYERHRDGSVTTDEFRIAAQDACKASGPCPPDLSDLSWFFDQWLRRGGVPHVQVDWSYDVGRRIVTLQIRQLQPQGPYRIPVELAVKTTRGENLSGRVRVVLAGPLATVAIRNSAEPSEVRLDPELWAPLMHVDFAKLGAPDVKADQPLR